MSIITGVSTSDEFLDAINEKGASLTNESTPEELLEAINATGGNVTFQSTNEEIVEAVNTPHKTIVDWDPSTVTTDIIFPKTVSFDPTDPTIQAALEAIAEWGFSFDLADENDTICAASIEEIEGNKSRVVFTFDTTSPPFYELNPYNGTIVYDQVSSADLGSFALNESETNVTYNGTPVPVDETTGIYVDSPIEVSASSAASGDAEAVIYYGTRFLRTYA